MSIALQKSRTVPLAVWCMLGISAFLPFEEFVLKWLPVPDTQMYLVRLVSEFFVYLLLLATIAGKLPATITRLRTSKPDTSTLQGTPIDGLLIAFLFLAMLSVFINGSSYTDALFNVRNLLRYVAIYYVAVNTRLEESDFRLLLRTLVAIALLECCLGFLQFTLGEGFTSFFQQREYIVQLEGSAARIAFPDTIKKIGSAIGTFGREGAMSYFLLLVSILVAAKKFLRSNFTSINPATLTLLVLMLGCFVTYKRGGLLLTLAMIPVVYLLYGRAVDLGKELLKLVLPAVVVLTLLLTSQFVQDAQTRSYVSPKEKQVSPVEALTSFLNPEYWEDANEQSRGWFIREVGSEALGSGRLLGLSADEEFTRKKLSESRETLRRIQYYGPFDDVYWIAMLVYYGYVGVFLFGLILWRLYWMSRTLSLAEDEFSKVLGVAFCTLLLVVIPLNCIERCFELRTFGFYFWLLAGFVANRHERLISQKPSPRSDPDQRMRFASARTP